jgi:hypothetical protein
MRYCIPSGYWALGTLMLVGALVGILIGTVSGVVTLVTIHPYLSIRGFVPANSGAARIATQLIGLPAFWFGGPWLSTKLLGLVDLNDFLVPYVGMLAVFYIAVVSYPLVIWIRSLGIQIGRV